MHPPDNARWLAFAVANGVKVVDGDTTDINSPAAVEALDFYASMVKDGTAGQPSDVGAGWPGEAFGKKRAAAVIEGGWMVPFLSDPQGGFNDVKYSAAPMPMSPSGNRGNLLFTNAYSASANTKFPKAASALILFLSGIDNQREVLKIGFALPTIKGFENDPYFESSWIR
jgi:multiple sugar transport system substrate-binding protein